MLTGNSDSVVDDLDRDSARLIGTLARALIFGDHFDHAALGRRGVGGVEEQIQQDLLNLVVVGERAAQIRRKDRYDLDAAETLVVGDEAKRLGDKPVDVDRAALRGGRAREVDQVFEGARDARYLRQDRMQRGAALRVGFTAQNRLHERRDRRRSEERRVGKECRSGWSPY